MFEAAERNYFDAQLKDITRVDILYFYKVK